MGASGIGWARTLTVLCVISALTLSLAAAAKVDMGGLPRSGQARRSPHYLGQGASRLDVTASLFVVSLLRFSCEIRNQNILEYV